MPIVHSTYFIFVFKAKFNPADANTSFYDIYLLCSTEYSCIGPQNFVKKKKT